MTSKTRTRKPSASPDPNQAALDGWLGRTYKATLPSGMEVEFRLPSLGELAALGELPSELQELAVAEWSQPGVGADLAAAPFAALAGRDEPPTEDEVNQAMELSRLIATRISALSRHVVAAALVNPRATVEQLEGLPYRDLEMLTVLVNRGTGIDAAGRHVGVVPLDTFQLVAQAHGAECDGAPDCPACRTAGRELAQLQ